MPLVVEAFGAPRDGAEATRCAADATTAVRDRFAAGVYEMVTQRRARRDRRAALRNWAARRGRARRARCGRRAIR